MDVYEKGSGGKWRILKNFGSAMMGKSGSGSGMGHASHSSRLVFGAV